MKKLVMVGLMLFCAGLVHAEGYGGVRSTTTQANEADVFLASGPVRILSVAVSSPGVGSALQLYNGQISAAASAIGPGIATTAFGQLNYDIVFSSGLIFSAIGAVPAEFTILYELVFPRLIDQQDLGYQ